MTIETLTGDHAEHDEDFWRLYDGSFPKGEREERAIILKGLHHEHGLGLRAEENGKTVGFLLGQFLSHIHASFLSYIAVDRSMEGKDIGTRLLQCQKALTADRYKDSHCGILLEIDRIDAQNIDEKERARRLRRLGFFRDRNGGQVLPIPYRQPPLDDAEVPMHLLLIPVTGGLPADPDSCRKMVDAVFDEKYGAVNGIPAEILMNTRKNIFG